MPVPEPFVVHVVAADVSAFKLRALQALCSRPDLPVSQRVVHVGPGLLRVPGLPRPVYVRAPLDLDRLRARALRRVLNDLTRACPIPLGRTLPDGRGSECRRILHVWSAVGLAWCAALADPEWALLVDADPGRGLWHVAQRLIARQRPRRSAFVCPTESVRARLRQLGAPAEACVLIRAALFGGQCPPYVEPVDFGTLDRAREADLRQRLNLTPEHTVVAVLPPVSRDAGTFTATWAALLLANVRPDVRLVVPGGVGREHERVRRAVRAVRHEHVVRFADVDAPLFGGQCPPYSLSPSEGRRSLTVAALSAELTGLADLAVFLPVRDVALTGLFQAMAAGRPIVATAVPAVSEFLVHGNSAWLCAPNSAEDAARRMLQVLEQPEEARRRADQARALARRRFAEAGVREWQAGVYANLAAGRPLSQAPRRAIAP